MNEKNNEHHCCRHCPVCRFKERIASFERTVARLKTDDPTLTNEDIEKVIKSYLPI